MHKTQSIYFDRSHWTDARARAWLKKHSYKSTGKMHATENELRFRQLEPDLFKKGKYYSISIGTGTIKLVIGDLKAKTTKKRNRSRGK